MLVSKTQLLQSSKIYAPLTAACINGEKLNGILLAVSNDYIEIETKPNTLQRRIPWTDVLTLNFTDKKTAYKASNACAWWNTKRAAASNQTFSLANCFRSTFDQIASKVSDSILSAIFESKSGRKLLFINDEEKLAFLNMLEPILLQIHASKEERSAARAFLYLAAKDYAGGIQELIQETSENQTDKSLLAIACFYQDMADGAAAFYWLGFYYDNISHCLDKDGLWWNYLLQAIAFDYYDDLVSQLLNLYDCSPSLAVKSLAFLFFAKNDFYTGSLLYKECCNDLILLSKEQYFTYFGTLAHSLICKEHYSYYARYHRNMQIITNEAHPLYESYQKDDNLYGIVYEFVPGQGYCKILGYDLLSYFLHFDDILLNNANNTKSIRQKLRTEICSFAPVEEELPVCINFTRTRGADTKKSYAVICAELSGIFDH